MAEAILLPALISALILAKIALSCAFSVFSETSAKVSLIGIPASVITAICLIVEILSLIGILDFIDFLSPANNSEILSSSGAEVSTAFMTIVAGNFCLARLTAAILLLALRSSSLFLPFSITVTLKYFIL